MYIEARAVLEIPALKIDRSKKNRDRLQKWKPSSRATSFNQKKTLSLSRLCATHSERKKKKFSPEGVGSSTCFYIVHLLDGRGVTRASPR